LILSGLKKSKYPLIKNEDSLNKEQAKKLISVKNVSQSLKVMYELKEKIRKIFNQTSDWYAGIFKLGMWLSEAKKYFPSSSNTIIRWWDEIIAYDR
jgi:transposase